MSSGEKEEAEEERLRRRGHGDRRFAAPEKASRSFQKARLLRDQIGRRVGLGLSYIVAKRKRPRIIQPCNSYPINGYTHTHVRGVNRNFLYIIVFLVHNM